MLLIVLSDDLAKTKMKESFSAFQEGARNMLLCHQSDRSCNEIITIFVPAFWLSGDMKTEFSDQSFSFSNGLLPNCAR